MITVKIAAEGRVITQERKIFLIRPIFKADKPFARPTPRTAPTIACVVDIGIPSLLATSIVDAAANSAAKPLVGVS